MILNRGRMILGRVGVVVAGVGATVWNQRAETRETDWQRKAGRSVPCSAYASSGMREKMEDEWFASEDSKFFAIFDGHRGSRVSHFLQENLYSTFTSQLERTGDIGKSLHAAFSEISDRIFAESKFDKQGSTAVTVYLTPDKLWAANLGDSRAVLCRDSHALDITTDHKPNFSEERKRIEAAGGHVRWYGYIGPDRQPIGGMGVYRIDGNLAVSRAFGDKDQENLISHEADIRSFERDFARDEFVILASDGLWDVLSSQAAVDFVQKVCCVGSFSSSSSRLSPLDLHLLKENVAKFLVEEALRCGSVDNVSCIVVWLT